MKKEQVCSGCSHTEVCGESGMYTDASSCNNFECYEERMTAIDKAKEETQYWKNFAENLEREVIELRAIKKTVEVIFGQKIDI